LIDLRYDLPEVRHSRLQLRKHQRGRFGYKPIMISLLWRWL
jgi:hypothetical protein